MIRISFSTDAPRYKHSKHIFKICQFLVLRLLKRKNAIWYRKQISTQKIIVQCYRCDSTLKILTLSYKSIMKRSNRLWTIMLHAPHFMAHYTIETFMCSNHFTNFLCVVWIEKIIYTSDYQNRNIIIEITLHKSLIWDKTLIFISKYIWYSHSIYLSLFELEYKLRKTETDMQFPYLFLLGSLQNSNNILHMVEQWLKQA